MVYDPNLVFKYLFSPFILNGVAITLLLTATSLVLGVIGGLLLAVAKMSHRSFLSRAADAYIGFFRGTPLLVQMIGIYTGLPQVGIYLSVIQSAILALALNEAAYSAEIIRAGIISVDPGQIEAARSLGMSYVLTLRRIIVPQAIRVIIPPLGNEAISLLKSTSLAAVISLEELLRRAQLIVAATYRTLELFTVAAIYYLIMTAVLTWVQKRIEKRLGRPWEREQQAAAQVERKMAHG